MKEYVYYNPEVDIIFTCKRLIKNKRNPMRLIGLDVPELVPGVIYYFEYIGVI